MIYYDIRIDKGLSEPYEYWDNMLGRTNRKFLGLLVYSTPRRGQEKELGGNRWISREPHQFRIL